MPSNSLIIGLLLFFALACQIPTVDSGVLSPFRKQGPPLCFTSSNRIESPLAYGLTLQKIRGVFTLNSTKNLCAHPFLPNQTKLDEAPFMWIPIALFGWDDDATALLFRNDNMYLIGFANKAGTWFAFKGYEHLIPGSIPIEIETSYRRLIGGWRNLNTIPLGMNSLEQAIRNLSNFDPSSSRMDHARISVAQLIIMFPEALRFFPIRDKVISGWESESFLAELAEKRLVLSWKDFVLDLMDWDKTKQWKGKNIIPMVAEKYSIMNEQDAFRVVDLLFVPRPYGC